MDHTLTRVKGAKFVSVAISMVFEATECAGECRAAKLRAELEDLAQQLIQLHRDFLELPPQTTPAACEFERAELNQDDVPF